ncbi:hypothetical protein BDW22DRAFT_184606 [Trametopsis cervina]|nr:hypothetical protein BDW22DRAFT_184606 [Trametopsis cervina]
MRNYMNSCWGARTSHPSPGIVFICRVGATLLPATRWRETPSLPAQVHPPYDDRLRCCLIVGPIVIGGPTTSRQSQSRSQSVRSASGLAGSSTIVGGRTSIVCLATNYELRQSVSQSSPGAINDYNCRRGASRDDMSHPSAAYVGRNTFEGNLLQHLPLLRPRPASRKSESPLNLLYSKAGHQG